ncbi:glycerol-3-phosphate dehydrogenase/oxidase [Spirosoma utsteinense]|uniref:Glycerol-3-phosphate dehydrogenase n=1 Tax=Spirosoma utsteinense TaxID=2585773 RepID=A0ABR6W482_9BACT|nr:FAD-dependent oxidoreductase [Spirosoma utsteinense]MBC3784255.1 glycerol-3-phosphate dehydrogenase [Spirosoma utsteinense]MBC3790948.1 glycerol-3-phosphate dehydrogenase [Spirosoma utsteinense]
MNREQNLKRLREETVDICIIGAGASGAGAALDAALRGYRVALIDRGDISGETSSRSTKLIHGGVRYLEQAIKKLDLAQLRQVRHGLAERRTVLRNAPHLAHPLALLTPVFSAFEGLYITIGLTLYDLIAGQDSFPKGRWLSRAQALAKMPTLTTRMHSAVLYYDGQLNDARYALALAHSADEAGATVVNYVSVTGFDRHDGRLETALVRDELTGDTFPVRARLFLNCTGPYSDSIRLLANPSLEQRIRPSKGVHIVLPRETLQSDCAMLIPSTVDGRVVFAIPFGDNVFVGTTDDDYTDLAKESVLEPQEIDYLLETLRPYLAKTPDRAAVQAGFGGIRPLIVSSRADTKTLLRDHEVEHDPESNLLSLLGGKWTTYRLMAQDAIDRAGELLGKSVASATETHFLVGGENYRFEEWQTLQNQYGLPTDVCHHLLQHYGTRASQVAQLIDEQPHLARRVSDTLPFLNAEVVYQVRHEMAVTPRDVLARRWRLELSNWQLTASLTPTVADLMAQELGWSETQRAAYVSSYQALLGSFAKQAGLPAHQQALLRV